MTSCYYTGTVWVHSKEKAATSLTDEQLLLATPVLYGFSLSDKLWRESCLILPYTDGY